MMNDSYSPSYTTRDLAVSTGSLSAPTRQSSTDSEMGSSLPSPSASAFLRTAATLEGLSRQLGDLKDEMDPGEGEMKCCCGATSGCPTWRARERMEDKLKLSGEIGDALLQRYEALERKHLREVEKFEHQLEVKRKALADSVRRVNNLEKANTTHMAHFTDVSKKNEALEKRYTQALHTQTLTQQSLTHVRSELTALRAKSQRQSISRTTEVEAEERFMESEKRYEELRDQYEVELRSMRDEARRRKRAEARVEELEGQLDLQRKEVDEVKEARARDAQELLANAKERLSILHSELSETFRADAPEEAPEYQKALEDLVASNALLKHDSSELSMLLSDSRNEVRSLKEEVDELRAAVGVAGRMTPDELPSSRRLASEIMRSHARTESSPNVGNASDRASWARMSVHVPASSRMWDHARKSSLAPSFASTSTSTVGHDLPSPGLGMGPIGEYDGILVNDGSNALSPTTADGRESPKPVFRTSPSGGIGYVLNGVPKNKNTVILPRPPVRRSSSDRPRPIRTYSPNQVDSIAEWPASDCPGATPPQVDEPLSPASTGYSREVDASRKRRSIILSRASTRDETDYISYSSQKLPDGSLASPRSDGATSPHDAKRVNRRTLLLLTKSVATQTEPIEEETHASLATSTATSPQPHHIDGSETSSLHDARSHSGAGVLTALVEHLAKTLTKLRSADIPSLNRRLKKQHLPGDVTHLSRSTLRALQTDVAELRTAFKGIFDVPIINRREFTLLLKLLKDVFGELIELQAIVNDVTIDPSLAKKLQKQAYRDEEAEEAKAKGAGGLGWIAAPITKFFVTPAQDTGEPTKQPEVPGMARVDRARLQTGTIKAPKQQASTSATTTHVSVEFGGAGIVRRATPAQLSGPVVDVLPPSPDPSGETTFAQIASAQGADSLAPPTVRRVNTLRPSKSRANRNELLGIFAGATKSVSPSGQGNWVVLPPGSTGISPIPQRQLRAASSQYFGDKTVRAQNINDVASRKRLSSAVDAVIDRTAHQIDETDPGTAGSYEPPLLERTLRPRGLSDSSIRSTFINHETAPPDPGLHARVQPYGMSIGGPKGYLGSFASRFYPFKATAPEPVAPDVASTSDTASSAPTSPPLEPTLIKTEAASPARPIPASPRAMKDATTGTSLTSANGSLPMGQSQSLFGMLASSITATAEVDREEEDDGETRGARLHRGVNRNMSGKAHWR